MTKINLGKVAVTPKGEYNAETQYTKLDIVSYQGASYMVLKDTIGITPAVGENYMLIAEKGEQGLIGERGPQGPYGQPGIGITKIETIPISDTSRRIKLSMSSGAPYYVLINDGQDGFSPTVSISNISGGKRIVITDKDGTKTADLFNGQNGTNGGKGDDGADGKSAYQLYVENGGTLTEPQWLASLAQGAPNYAPSEAWLNSNGDITKAYLGSNGNLWAYMEQERIVVNNEYNNGEWELNKRLNSSGGTTGVNGSLASPLIEIDNTQSGIVNISGLEQLAIVYFQPIHVCFFDESQSFIANITASQLGTGTSGQPLSLPATINLAKSVNGNNYWSNAKYVRFDFGISTSTINSSNCENLVVNFEQKNSFIIGEVWSDTGIQYANYQLTAADADVVADKVLSRLDVSYVSSDKVLTVGQYTFRYDGEAVADIGVTT